MFHEKEYCDLYLDIEGNSMWILSHYIDINKHLISHTMFDIWAALLWVSEFFANQQYQSWLFLHKEWTI